MPFDERYVVSSEKQVAAELEHALDRMRNRDRGPEPVMIDGQPCCAECEEPMPKRARLGYGRCIDCQSRHERTQGE